MKKQGGIMMRSQREESFRYTFREPKIASFQIIRIDDLTVETSSGDGKIIDISPEGIKLYSELSIPETDHKAIHLSIYFELNGEALNYTGVIAWKHALHYGIDLFTDESDKSYLTKQLKIHARKAVENNH